MSITTPREFWRLYRKRLIAPAASRAKENLLPMKLTATKVALVRAYAAINTRSLPSHRLPVIFFGNLEIKRLKEKTRKVSFLKSKFNN